MKRIVLFSLLLPALGCAAPAERLPLQPLPENGQVLPYADLVSRVNAQWDAASDAFYLDRWGSVEDTAKGIEQTARFLSKAKDVPPRNKDTLNEVTADLAKNAGKLREAAAAKNENATMQALKHIKRNVAQLRVTD